MKSVPFFASLALNVLLALTIANIYVSDRYFQDWVSVTIGPLSPFLVLTLAVGGGSGLGYLFLQRKHPSQRVSAKLPKARFPKPGITVVTPLTVGKALPSSASQGPIPRQVAYAVPPPTPPPKPGSSISKPSSSPMSLSAAPKPGTVPPPQPSVYPTLARSEQPGVKRPDLAPTPPIIQPRTASTDQWQPDSRVSFPVRPDTSVRPGQAGSGPGFQPPTSPIPQGQVLPQTSRPTLGVAPGPGQVQVPQKWQPSGQPSSPAASGLPRQDIDPTQKWAPPPNRPYGQQPPPPTVIGPSSQPFRPNPQGFTPPSKPPLSSPSSGPQSQFTQRPLGPPQRPLGPPFQTQGGPGSPRQGELGPVAVPRQFRPEQDRPMGQSQQPPRPAPTPQPWVSPQSPPPPLAKPRPSDNPPSAVFPKPSQNEAPASQVPRPSESPQKPGEQPSPTAASTAAPANTPESSGAGGSEMDWDTALDTILKTLRRDRIRDEQ